jgi:hypothetical protein
MTTSLLVPLNVTKLANEMYTPFQWLLNDSLKTGCAITTTNICLDFKKFQHYTDSVIGTSMDIILCCFVRP